MGRPEHDYPRLLTGPHRGRHGPTTMASVLWFLAGAVTTLVLLAVAGVLG
jgi:hypothetical protein